MAGFCLYSTEIAEIRRRISGDNSRKFKRDIRFYSILLFIYFVLLESYYSNTHQISWTSAHNSACTVYIQIFSVLHPQFNLTERKLSCLNCNYDAYSFLNFRNS